MPPAARLTDLHTCPRVAVRVPRAGGPILSRCEITVPTGGLPRALSEFRLAVGFLSADPNSRAHGESVEGTPLRRMSKAAALGLQRELAFEADLPALVPAIATGL